MTEVNLAKLKDLYEGAVMTPHKMLALLIEKEHYQAAAEVLQLVTQGIKEFEAALNANPA